jgi:nicotinamide-nucleotide amidase
MNDDQTQLESLAKLLVGELRVRKWQLVLAESCTAGLVSATLATIPGVSDSLCGSAVTYQDQTKMDWIAVRPESIAARTAVSEQVAQEMALGVLGMTVQANLAAAVTGHLGPGAPTSLDGVAFVAIARRFEQVSIVRSERFELSSTTRQSRQREAATRVIESTFLYLRGA